MAEPPVQDKDEGLTYLELSLQLRSKFERSESPPAVSTPAPTPLHPVGLGNISKNIFTILYFQRSPFPLLFCPRDEKYFLHLCRFTNFLLLSFLYKSQQSQQW